MYSYFAVLQDGGRLLHFAAHFGRCEIIEMLVDEYEADPAVVSNVSWQ